MHQTSDIFSGYSSNCFGERQRIGWKRSLETAFPEVEVQKVFAEDCQRLLTGIRLLSAECWNCKFRRSFCPGGGFCEEQELSAIHSHPAIYMIQVMPMPHQSCVGIAILGP